MVYLIGDAVFDLLEFGFSNKIFWVATMQVSNDPHAFLISVYIYKPSESTLTHDKEGTEERR